MVSDGRLNNNLYPRSQVPVGPRSRSKAGPGPGSELDNIMLTLDLVFPIDMSPESSLESLSLLVLLLLFMV